MTIKPEAASAFFNPATGEWITYTVLAEDSDGQLVRFTWRSVPGGVITEHIHPHQEERFTILAGEAHMLPPLWALAKAFGVRPYYDRWDSRVRGAG